MKEKGLALPEVVVVKTLEAPAFLNRPAVPPGTLDCPVDPQGNWSCSLPAATFNLVVTAEGFTPHYRWRIEIPPARRKSLGTFVFEPGSSVAAWVAVEGGAIEVGSCIARLAPLAACDADLKAVAQLGQTAVERPVGRDGFVQIAGLSPGNYSLEVRQPGLASARVGNVRVLPRTETFLRAPLVLTRPLSIEVSIVPPLDESDERWHAQVTRRVEGGPGPDPIVYEGPADIEGRFRIADQSPGLFQIDVLDARGNRVYAEPERQLDSSSQMTIQLRRFRVEGLLRLGKQPIAGTLWFGGQYGARRVRMEAGEEGIFHGVLADGSWLVEIEGAHPAFRTRTRVEIRPNESGRAEVTIELPDTRIFGRVVDAEGRPVPRATAGIAAEGLDLHIRTDESGTFEFRGLTAGAVALMAVDDKGRQSERTLVSLLEGRPVGPIDVKLRPSRSLEGSVLSSRGPVAGALVTVRATAPTIGIAQATTGVEGTFTIDLPANLSSGTAVVSAPGFGTKVFPLTSIGKSLALTMEEGAGRITVALPRSPEALFRENLSVLVFQEGLEIPVSHLQGGAGPRGGQEGKPVLQFGDLAPGSYLVCLQKRKVELKGSAVSADDVSDLQCERGALAAGGTLSLALRDAGGGS